MKKALVLATLSVLALSACNNGLNDKDRAMLKETHDLAVQANETANKAAADAKAANDNAMMSAKSAEKADRIFRQGQNK